MLVDDLRQFPGRIGYRAIVDCVAGGIASGRLAPGQRLPPQRDLAEDLGIAIATVGRAYAELEARGLTRSHVGRGTFVQPCAPGEGQVARAERAAIDLATYRVPVPPLDVSFRQTLVRLAGEADTSRLLGPVPAGGLPEHRRALAAWLAGAGIDAGPERIVLTNGGQHGMLAALSAVARPGQTVATEEVTDPRMKSVAGYLDRRLAGVACDADGMLPDDLDRLCRAAPVAAIYVTPRHHNPTNATLPPERRRALVRVARAHGLPIVESGIYGTLDDYWDAPLVTMAPERTWFVTSLGRIAGPGMKLGCLVAPPGEAGRAPLGVAMSTGTATPLLAELAALWIREGQIAEMTRWQRAEAFRRQAVLSAHPGLAGARRELTSHHAWLALPEPWRAEDLVAAAAAEGVALAPTHGFVVGRREVPHAVRLVLGAPADTAALAAACARLEALLRTPPPPAAAG